MARTRGGEGSQYAPPIIHLNPVNGDFCGVKAFDTPKHRRVAAVQVMAPRIAVKHGPVVGEIPQLGSCNDRTAGWTGVVGCWLPAKPVLMPACSLAFFSVRTQAVGTFGAAVPASQRVPLPVTEQAQCCGGQPDSPYHLDRAMGHRHSVLISPLVHRWCGRQTCKHAQETMEALLHEITKPAWVLFNDVLAGYYVVLVLLVQCTTCLFSCTEHLILRVRFW